MLWCFRGEAVADPNRCSSQSSPNKYKLGWKAICWVAGRRLKQKAREPVVFVVLSNLKPNGTFAGFYLHAGFEISQKYLCILEIVEVTVK
jgi:hypothetical protein